MKLTVNENKTITNKSGRKIAEIREGKLFISQKDFRRAIKQIRELLSEPLYIVID